MSARTKRLEQEINKILEESGPLGAVRSDGSERGGGTHPLSNLSPTGLLVASFAIMLVGALADEVLPFAGVWLVLAGAGLFIAGFALVLFGPHDAGVASWRRHRGLQELSQWWRARSGR